MSKKPKKEELGNNPFSLSLEIPVRKEELKTQYKKVDGILLPVQLEMEVTEFVRFYSSPERRQFRNALSPRAKEMLLWIMDELEYNEDFIWINRQRYMKENSIKSMTTYNETVNELVRYGQISFTVKKDTFWINPDFMFKGNRVQMFSKNVISK